MASFSWQSEARTNELVAAEQTKSRSVLNLDLLEGLNKQSQWQFSKLQEAQGSRASIRVILADKSGIH